MFSIEIWYLWYMQYVLRNSYTVFYTKFILKLKKKIILCNCYLV